MNNIDKNYLTKKYLRNSPIKWKNQGFVIIPHELLFNEKVNRPALMVFWVLTAHLFRGKTYCFPSLSALEKETRFSRPSVIKGIKCLKDLGYLEVEGGKKTGKVNKYYLKVKV